MALRLSRAFDTISYFWLNLQKNFDLWHAETKTTEWKKVKTFSHKTLHPRPSPLGSEQSD